MLVLALYASCGANKNSQNITAPSATAFLSPSPSAASKEAKAASTLRFVVMADCRGSDGGINKQSIEKTLEDIKNISPQPSFAVLPGDLVGGTANYTDEKTQLLNFKDTITKYYPISFFYPGFGNHEATAGEQGVLAFSEVFSEFKANFLKGFKNTVYYFDNNDARFYMLNTNYPGEEHQVSNAQINWIKDNADSNKKYNLYFFHEPAFPTGAHIGSSLDTNKLQRDKLWETIDQSENPIVFCGHEHNYTRRHINSDFNESVGGLNFKFTKSVYQVTVGTFGAPIYTSYRDKKDIDVPPVYEYHFAIVDLYNRKIQIKVYDLEGKIIDSFAQ